MSGVLLHWHVLARLEKAGAVALQVSMCIFLPMRKRIF